MCSSVEIDLMSDSLLGLVDFIDWADDGSGAEMLGLTDDISERIMG